MVDHSSKAKDEGNRINGDSVSDFKDHDLQGFELSAFLVRGPVVPAAAAMTVCGVMCMRRFILRRILYSSLFFLRNLTNPTSQINGGGIEAIEQKKKKECEPSG